MPKCFNSSVGGGSIQSTWLEKRELIDYYLEKMVMTMKGRVTHNNNDYYYFVS
jgi:hypothetical protein